MGTTCFTSKIRRTSLLTSQFRDQSAFEQLHQKSEENQTIGPCVVLCVKTSKRANVSDLFNLKFIG